MTGDASQLKIDVAQRGWNTAACSGSDGEDRRQARSIRIPLFLNTRLTPSPLRERRFLVRVDQRLAGDRCGSCYRLCPVVQFAEPLVAGR